MGHSVRARSFSAAVMALAATVAAEEPSRRLPSVDAVFNKVASQVSNFTNQAHSIYERVSENQKMSKASLEMLKASFEANLTRQQKRIDEVQLISRQLRTQASKVRHQNKRMRAEIGEIKHGNELLRRTFSAWIPKLDLAKDFVVQSLKTTDVSSSEKLAVLETPRPKATLGRLLETPGTETEAPEETVLLQVGSLMHSSLEMMLPDEASDRISKNTEKMTSMVGGLMTSLKDLEGAALEGQAVFKASFQEFYAQGERHLAEVNAEKDDINATLLHLRDTTDRLVEAHEVLNHTRQDLIDRAKGINMFAQQLGRTALSAVSLVEGGAETAETKRKAAPAKAAASTTTIRVTTTTTKPQAATKPATQTGGNLRRRAADSTEPVSQ